MTTHTGNSGFLQHLIIWVKPRTRILAPLFTLIVLAVFFGIVTDHFLTLRNLENIIEQASLLAVLATGVTMVLLLGEIDLSFANAATLVGMTMALMTDNEIAIGLIIPVCILISLAVGFTNGYVSSYIRVPSFMATLAMYQIAYGIAHYASHATPVFSVPEGHYFFMGDNRDNSTDSRVNQLARGVGFVPAENLIGRADRIMFSSAGKSLFYVWTWRGDRFFKGIE